MITEEDMIEYGNEALLSDYVSISETLGKIYDVKNGVRVFTQADLPEDGSQATDRLEAEAATMKAEIHRRMKRGEHGLTSEEGALLEEIAEAVWAEAFTVFESDGVTSHRFVLFEDVDKIVYSKIPIGVAAPAIVNSLRAESYTFITDAYEDYFVLSPGRAVDIITEIYRKA